MEDKWGPINEEQFTKLPENNIIELLKAKIECPESNAGIIIDNLNCDLYKD